MAVELTQLAEQAATALDPAGGAEGLKRLEGAIRTAMSGLGARLLEGLLAGDRGHRGARIDCGQGHEAEFIGYRTKQIDTILGSATCERAWYHCTGCRHGFAPRDIELGMADASLTPGLRRMVARVAADHPFAQGRDVLAELAGIELTAKRIERSAEADGQMVAAATAAEADAVLAGNLHQLETSPGPVDTLYVTMDGTGVPCVPAATQDRAGKRDDGRARTREVKLACLFTQTGLDDDGRPVRDPHSSSYVATFEPSEAFGTLVYAEARRRGIHRARRRVVLGDGAPWIWNLAAMHFPDATGIVDLYHARQHLHELAQLAAPALAGDQRDWLTDRLDDLDRGDIPGLAAAARALELPDTLAAEIDDALSYFETNQTRMRYTTFRKAGLFIGSGAIEYWFFHEFVPVLEVFPGLVAGGRSRQGA